MIPFKDALLLTHLPNHPFSIASCPALRAARLLEPFPAVFWGANAGLHPEHKATKKQTTVLTQVIFSPIVFFFFFGIPYVLFPFFPEKKNA